MRAGGLFSLLGWPPCVRLMGVTTHGGMRQMWDCPQKAPSVPASRRVQSQAREHMVCGCRKGRRSSQEQKLGSPIPVSLEGRDLMLGTSSGLPHSIFC